MLVSRAFGFAGPSRRAFCRSLSTLASNPSIKVFPHPQNPEAHILTYLLTDPPSPSLAIGTTTALPPTPRSFSANPGFLRILNSVLAEHAAKDAGLISQAKALASPGGATFQSGGGFASASRSSRAKETPATDSEGASGQGGPGGGGVGGWVHLSDLRNPPDFGRIAWPEDIFGSVEVDAHGNIIGNFQPSGTYRIVTNEGILGLSPFLEGKLVERLREEEAKEKKRSGPA